MHYERRSGWWLLVRSLLPSGGSITGSVLIAVAIIGFHVLLLSQDANLLLPHFAGTMNDQLAEVYAATILGPIDRALGTSAISTVTTAAVWGLIGWAVYALADFLLSRLRELRSSNREITMPVKNQVVYHPLHRQIVIRLLWRFFIGMLFVLLTLALQPAVSALLGQDILFLRADTIFEMLGHAAISFAGWTALLHMYVVLFRFFVLRTRVFGEIIY